jgi:hypothetical protein
MVRLSEGSEAQHVRRCPVKDEKYFDLWTELLLKFGHCRSRVGVIAVTYHVAVIGVRQSLQDFWMHPGTVVTGETAR